MGARTRSGDTRNKPVNFDDDFDTAFTVKNMEYTTGSAWSPTRGRSFTTWGRREYVSRSLQTKALEIAEMARFGIAEALAEVLEPPHQQQQRGVAEVSFLDRGTVLLRYISLGGNIFWNHRIINRLELLEHRFWGP